MSQCLVISERSEETRLLNEVKGFLIFGSKNDFKK